MMKKTIITIVSAVLLLCLASCGNGTPAETDPPIESAKPLDILVSGASDYNILVSDDDDEHHSAANQFKRLFFDKTGVELKVKTDFDKEDVSAHEIVIGETDRENTSLTPEMKTRIYRDGFIIMAVGERLWICGENGESTAEGVKYFIDNYVLGTTLTLDSNFSCIQERIESVPVQNLTISGNSLSDYSIVCKKSLKTVYSVAEKLQTEMWNQAGVYLPIRDVDENCDKKILLETVATGAPNYTLKTDGANLLLSGTNKDYLTECVNYISREYFGRRTCNWASEKYYEAVPTDVAIQDLSVVVAYNKIDTLTLGGKNISEYVIMYDSQNSTSSTSYAAQELQKYLSQTTGSTLSIDKTNALVNKPLIKLVYNKEMGDNYSLKTSEGGLTISGGDRGILYGVYNFLEDYVGWAFLPYGTDVLMYEEDTLAIDNIDVDYTQYFEYRAPQFQAHVNADFSAKNMLNSTFSRLGTNHGGTYGFTGSFGHTLSVLLEGEGANTVGANPCIYNENNYKTILASVKAILEKNPNAQIISVSANDSSAFCQCDGCTGKRIGGNATDAYIAFINRIAEDIEDEYPDVQLHMLSYSHTYYPPTKVRPKDNIIVQLANIDCCFQHPIKDQCCEANRDFLSRLKEWSKWSDNLYMWDYATDFLCFYTTFPNFDALKENIKLYYEHGVKGIMEQGDMNNVFSKFEELEAYVIAKLMENPYMTDAEYDALIDKYMIGYYGPGGEYIRQYYDFLMESSNKRDQHFGIYAQPEYLYDENDFITKGAEIEEWFAKAMDMATTDAQLYHLRTLRISFRYMKLWFTYDYARRTYTSEQFNAFKAECVETFNDMVRERYRTQDVHSELGKYIGIVDPEGHPRWWNTVGNIWDKVPPHGMGGSDATGDLYA